MSSPARPGRGRACSSMPWGWHWAPARFASAGLTCGASRHSASPAWKLRGGIAWDPTPVRQEFITPRIPDADRTWLAIGAQYQSSAQSTWEVGYAHLFIKDASIDKREPPAGGRLVGRYGVDADILSVQYTRSF